MNKEELSLLIKRITQEVLYRIEQAKPVDETVKGTLVLVSSYVPSPKTALARIKEIYGSDGIEFINFGTDFTPLFEKAGHYNGQNADEILKKAAEAKNIVLITPKISLLDRIGKGEDEGFLEHLIIRSLLWGRNTGIMLDFQPPHFKRNTFFEKVLDVLETLTDMGIRTFSYAVSTPGGERALTLVTEQDVMDAYRNKHSEVLAASGAIVTPAAKDKAKELDIEINY